MAKLTVQFLETKGQDPRGNYKNYVKFTEEAETVYWATKTIPVVGDVVEGTIEQGQYGPKFKRAWNSDNLGGVAPRVDKSREDGMRQGMCFNNASQYVLKASEGKTLSPEQWARAVYVYATALYALGDIQLDKIEEVPVHTEADVPEITKEEVQTIDEIFGIK